MAARKAIPSKEQQERTRAAIKTTQLVKRLQCFALGEKDDAENIVELDANKLRAVEILLRKALPDLSTVTLQGDEGGGAIRHKIEFTIVDPDNTR